MKCNIKPNGEKCRYEKFNTVTCARLNVSAALQRKKPIICPIFRKPFSEYKGGIK